MAERLQGWRRLAGFDRAEKADLVRAAAELLVARLQLYRKSTAALLEMQDGGASLSPSAMVDRVSFAVPRVAARLPWRSDCLVQALAARRWLAAYAISTSLFLGVRKEGEQFIAHAWLKAGPKVVTGGNIASYTPISTENLVLWRNSHRA